MRTEEHRPVRLEDYRPPDWLIDTVDLDVSLDPNATRVRAKLKVRPNTGAAPAPLVLDGEELKLVSLLVDGKPYYHLDKPAQATPESWPFDGPESLILNVAMGGGWAVQKGIDDAALPARMEVDYVRVYQKK